MQLWQPNLEPVVSDIDGCWRQRIGSERDHFRYAGASSRAANAETQIMGGRDGIRCGIPVVVHQVHKHR